jgi:MFS transporter, putative metabolite:H+ symporter
MSQNTILDQFDRARLGKFHLKLMLLAGACWMLGAYGVTIIGFLLPSLRTEWQVSQGALGLAAAMGMVGMLVGSITAGTLADRFGRRSTLTWTLLYLGVVFLVSAEAWNYPVLLILRLLTGIGLGAILPVSSTLVTEFSPARYRGAMAVLLNACWGLGGTLAALAGYTLVLKFGWRPAMQIGGLALVIGPLVHFLLPESMRFLLGKGRQDEAQKEFSRLHLQTPPADLPTAEAARPEAPAAAQPKGGIWSPAYARLTSSLWFIWIALNFLYQGAFIWLPTLLTSSRLSEGRSFLFTLLISLGQVPGTLIAAWLADRVSRRKLIITSLALLSAATLLFGLSHADAWVLVLGFLLMGFNGMAWGLAYPFSSELYPTRMRGLATGWAAGIGRLGGVAAPIVVAWVIQAGGSLGNVFTLLACAPFLSTLVLSSIKLETTGRSLEEISSG